MINQMLSTLARGKGKNGQAYDDYKPKYPERIPYYLREVAKSGVNFPPLPKEKNYRLLPGTYMTDKGQMILYTRAKKAKNLAQETVDSCAKLSELYDIVHTVEDEFRHNDTENALINTGIGDIPALLGSLKNNWFYPKMWTSPAKELVPEEALRKGYDFKDYLLSRKPSVKQTNYVKQNSFSLKKISSVSLTDVSSNINDAIPEQMQNNAKDTGSDSLTDQSISSFDNLDESIDGSGSSFSSYNDSGDSSGNERFCDVDENFLIPRNAVKKGFHFMDERESLFGEPKKIEIAEVLGGDSILSDIKTKDVNAIPLRPAKSSKNEQNENLRVNMLKDLYEKLNFLSMAKRQLKIFSENILLQFQNYNSKNRNIRIANKRKTINQTLQEMKERNDEIRLRLQKLSEKKILDRKDSMEKSHFTSEWDCMLLELSRKTKLDMEMFEKRKMKLLLEEEEKIKEFENEQMKVEHSSIVFAFANLKHELIKLDEEKNDIEHFIIRLEMGRENINKIEREIMTETPQPYKLNKSNFQGYLSKIKELTVINWQLKMCDLAKDFNLEECKLLDSLPIDCELDSTVKEKDTKLNTKNINLNACSTDLDARGESHKLSSSADIEDIPTESQKFQLPRLNQKNYLMKLDYEMMKVDQKISANHTYSYFIPWPRENYERNMGNNVSSINSDSEEETVKPKRLLKLDYKRILAHNPLKDKKRRKCRK